MPTFIKITPFKKAEIQINADNIVSMSPCKIGQFYADFGTDPRGPIADEGVDGTKITLADKTTIKTIETAESIQARIQAAKEKTKK